MIESSEGTGITRFLELVSAMLHRSDFLLPLAAGQRQFRQDNYNMASAALLEDLFFDAFGMYLRENHPRVSFERRSGKELWDYGFGGLKISHKETLTGDIAVWWTAGDRIDGKWVPKPEFRYFTAQHPIVLVLSGCGAMTFSSRPPYEQAPGLTGDTSTRIGRLLGPIGVRAVKGDMEKSLKHPLLLASLEGIDVLRVERIWAPDDWAALSFHDLWAHMGGPNLATRDLWVARSYASSSAGIYSIGSLRPGAELHLNDSPLLPGIYVIPSTDMVQVPMVANNRAHSFAPDSVRELLDRARREARFIPFPLWFAHYAEAPPPNLYGRQRAQYEDLFAARRRS